MNLRWLAYIISGGLAWYLWSRKGENSISLESIAEYVAGKKDWDSGSEGDSNTSAEISKQQKSDDRGKYYPLEQYLTNSRNPSETLSYSQIERILGAELPKSAYKYRSWWANGGNYQPDVWLNAGWNMNSIGLGKSVEFIKES